MTELGRASVLYGTTRNVFNIAIRKLTDVSSAYDYRNTIMLVNLNLQQRVGIIAILFHQTVVEHPQFKIYKKVINIIKRAQKFRNKLMNRDISFYPDSGNVQLSSMSASGSHKATSENIYIKELVKTSAAIHKSICFLNTNMPKNKISYFLENKILV